MKKLPNMNKLQKEIVDRAGGTILNTLWNRPKCRLCGDYIVSVDIDTKAVYTVFGPQMHTCMRCANILLRETERFFKDSLISNVLNGNGEAKFGMCPRCEGHMFPFKKQDNDWYFGCTNCKLQARYTSSGYVFFNELPENSMKEFMEAVKNLDLPNYTKN